MHPLLIHCKFAILVNVAAFFCAAASCITLLESLRPQHPQPAHCRSIQGKGVSLHLHSTLTTRYSEASYVRLMLPRDCFACTCEADDYLLDGCRQFRGGHETARSFAFRGHAHCYCRLPRAASTGRATRASWDRHHSFAPSGEGPLLIAALLIAVMPLSSCLCPT